MSRLRYYWVARDSSTPSGGSAKGSKQGNVESIADEDSLAIGSNVELQMLHSKYENIYFLVQSKYKFYFIY